MVVLESTSPPLLWMNLEDSSEQGGIVTRLNTDSPLDFEVFFERYKPISNPFNSKGLYEGRLFHHYHYLEDSEEARFLAGAEPKKLWTLCFGEYGLHIRAGMSFVDREGFFVARVTRSSALEDDLMFEDVHTFKAL